MPLYEFRCQECGHQTEQTLKFSDPLPKDCPACTKPALQKLISSKTGFVLKGSGWYVTDFKDGNTKGKPGSCSGES